MPTFRLPIPGVLLAASILVTACTCSVAAEPEPAPPQPAAKPKFKISKETTYITEPLRPDGYPDYVAALNQRMSRGVTPENNAAVLLVEAFGPKVIPKDKRQNSFKLLGIEPLAEKGDYFVFKDEIVERWKAGKLPIDAKELPKNDFEEFAAFEPAKERPWSREEFPAAAQWLKANEKPLQLIIAASKRPQYFVPQVGVDGKWPPLIDGMSGFFLHRRDANDLLITSAMFKLHANDSAGAWSDLMAAHRLARLVEAEPSQLSVLLAKGLERFTNEADAVFLHHAKLTKEDLQKIRKERYGLSTLPNLKQMDYFSERCAHLDAICFVARNGDDKAKNIWAVFLSPDDPLPRALVKAVNSAPIDWNIPLKVSNEWFDQWNGIQQIADPAAQNAAIAQLQEEITKLSDSVTKPDQAAEQRFAANPSQEASLRVANALVSQLIFVGDTLNRVDSMSAMSGEMLKCAFALTEYRLDHGEYPKELNDLVPKYLAKVPIDSFSPKSETIRYRRDGEAYALWSIGPNRVDDGGKSIGLDFNSTADDEVFRPAPATPVKTPQ